MWLSPLASRDLDEHLFEPGGSAEGVGNLELIGYQGLRLLRLEPENGVQGVGPPADAETLRQLEQSVGGALRPVGNEGDGKCLVELVNGIVDQYLCLVEHHDPAGKTLDIRKIVG